MSPKWKVQLKVYLIRGAGTEHGCSNLYKTFGSPWSESSVRAEAEFTLPSCYLQQAPRLQPGSFTKFQEETLFYIFYSMPQDEAQLYAADELATRGWAYHKELKVFFPPTTLSSHSP